MKKHIHVDLYEVTEHAQKVMRDLGITYQFAVPQSLFDCWQFWNCENVPEVLPKGITVQDWNPRNFIGNGLSEAMAKAIEDAAEPPQAKPE